MALAKTGHAAAKLFGIKLHQPIELRHDAVTRGESIASQYTTDSYIEPEPTVDAYIRDLTPSRADVVNYLRDLVPFTKWIRFYNRIWLLGDMVAGITVGAVVVPQGMAYASLANLPVQYGLYSSFVGVIIYWFFATSKDITIGPVAVLSTVTGQVITDVRASNPELTAPVIASALAVLCGAFVFTLGILRLGFIVDFIPLVSIAAFMTGSAINIAAGQVPTMMGITGFNTRDAPYLVIIHTLQGLPRTSIDAAMGLTALTMLYLIRSFCQYMARHRPNHAKVWFFISTLRTAFVILLYTMISWLVNMNRRSSPLFKILGTVPRGFTAMGVPVISHDVLTGIAVHLPPTIIVLLIEHIAIAKSFGRVNNYTINPSQELIAMGITNIFGPFFGAYPATGSFSRTAIKSKAGVRTPLAGLITGIVVLLALYALPPVFFYIPNASLAAVIIHAVLDLITPPNVVYGFWRVNPLEAVIWFAGLIVTIFSSIENGIYVTIATSGGLLLYRIAKAHGEFLGKIRVQTLDGQQPRSLFVPLDHSDGLNPAVPVEEPYEGVFVFRFTESFVYPNANHYTDAAVAHIFSRTRRSDPHTYKRPGDRPWNDPMPSELREGEQERPTLKAIIFDMDAVSHIDVTSTQILVDVRQQLDRYVAPDRIDIHFAGIRNPWTRRSLLAAGFGTLETGAKPVFSIANFHDATTGGNEAFSGEAVTSFEKQQQQRDDIESSTPTSASKGPSPQLQSRPSRSGTKLPILSMATPTFHADLDEALHAVLVNLGASTESRTGSLSDVKEAP